MFFEANMQQKDLKIKIEKKNSKKTLWSENCDQIRVRKKWPIG